MPRAIVAQARCASPRLCRPQTSSWPIAEASRNSHTPRRASLGRLRHMARLYVAFRRARHALESIGAQLSFANRSARSLASRSNRLAGRRASQQADEAAPHLAVAESPLLAARDVRKAPRGAAGVPAQQRSTRSPRGLGLAPQAGVSTPPTRSHAQRLSRAGRCLRRAVTQKPCLVWPHGFAHWLVFVRAIAFTRHGCPDNR